MYRFYGEYHGSEFLGFYKTFMRKFQNLARTDDSTHWVELKLDTGTAVY